MKTPLIIKLNAPAIINVASHLKQKGQLANSKNNLVYLDIDDAYIHKLFPLLQDHQIKMPILGTTTPVTPLNNAHPGGVFYF